MKRYNYYVRGNEEHGDDIKLFFSMLGANATEINREDFYNMTIIIFFMGKDDVLYRISQYDSYNGFPAYNYITSMLEELPIGKVCEYIEKHGDPKYSEILNHIDITLFVELESIETIASNDSSITIEVLDEDGTMQQITRNVGEELTGTVVERLLVNEIHKYSKR